MSPTPGIPVVNRLLAALPELDRRRLLAACATVELAFGDVLCEAGGRVTHAYFPTRGFISLIMPVDEASSLEVGLVGNEGMFGVPLALGVDLSPVRAVVQGTGAALLVDATTFGRELARSQPLRDVLNRYVYIQLGHLAQTAACTRFHVVEERLARWLLMTQDRAHASHFHITQEFLAFMLGVRRVGVTKAARALQDRGLISYSRGEIRVLDRRGLRTAACQCYRSDLAAYDRMLG